MKKQSFLKGALILMIAGFINRVIGFILRVIIVRNIGDHGLGLFQMIYPLFMTLLLISTAGFPVAISKLIPEKLASNKNSQIYSLLKTTLIFVFFMSIIISIFLFFSAEFIANRVYNDSRVYIIIISIIPALIISPLAASFRGFFQGMHNMIPTALSQITEQTSRFLATILLINMLGYLGLRYQSAGIALGISVGEFSGLLLLIFFFLYHLKKSGLLNKLFNSLKNNKNNFICSFKTITALAVPITIGRIINSLMMSGEAVLIPRQLQKSGISVDQAASLYGQLSGMVEQLLFLPTVITIALTISLIPNISDAYARNNMKKIRNNYQDIIRISIYLGLPIIVIFIQNGKDICNILFGYPEAGRLLTIMAFSAPFIYFLQVSHGMLNGLGKPQLAVFNLSIGSLLKLAGIFYLTQQTVGIYGAAVSIGLGYVLSAVLNFIVIGHTIGYTINIIQCFIKPLLCSGTVYLLTPYLTLNKYITLNINFKIEKILNIFIIICIYLILMCAVKAINKDDINHFIKK